MLGFRTGICNYSVYLWMHHHFITFRVSACDERSNYIHRVHQRPTTVPDHLAPYNKKGTKHPTPPISRVHRFFQSAFLPINRVKYSLTLISNTTLFVHHWSMKLFTIIRGRMIWNNFNYRDGFLFGIRSESPQYSVDWFYICFCKSDMANTKCLLKLNRFGVLY